MVEKHRQRSLLKEPSETPLAQHLEPEPRPRVEHWTDEEIIREFKSDSLLNRVRKDISLGVRQVLGGQELRPSTELRRIEFGVAERVIDLVKRELGG